MHKNINNNKVYIGVIKQKPLQRWQNGEGYKNNEHFYSAIKKYGWDNFEHTILELVDTIEEASNKERYWISFYDSTNPEKGYNLDSGGYDGRIFSEETRRKMSESHLGEKNGRYGVEVKQETRDKISKANKGKLTGEKNPMYGKTHSPEAIEKIKAANQEPKPWKYKAVRCITTNKTFKSIKEATAYYNLGTNGKHISSVCLGKRKHCGKDPDTKKLLEWEYVTEEEDNNGR